MASHSRSAQDSAPANDSASARVGYSRQVHDEARAEDSVSAVVVKLAPAVARATASLDLKVISREVAELTAEQRAVLARMGKGATVGVTAGGIGGGLASVATGEPWITPAASVTGGLAGAYLGEALHDRPIAIRAAARIADFVRRVAGFRRR